MLVDLLEEEPLEVAVVFLSAYTSFENTWYSEIFDEVVLDDHGASLVLGISFLVKADRLRLGAQSPKSQRVVNNMVVQIHRDFRGQRWACCRSHQKPWLMLTPLSSSVVVKM